MKYKIPFRTITLTAAMALAAGIIGCLHHRYPPPGTKAHRAGDEIVVCGQMFHTGTRVVLWDDPGGYNAYSTYKRFGPFPLASYEATTDPAPYAEDAGITDPKKIPKAHPDWSPNRYGYRIKGATTEQIEKIRAGWTLPDLQKKVDQFVIHYDDCGTSQVCFRVLQDQRNLSVHFMLDLDGTIYQTLDLQERAWHATISNDRSVGIEIANMGSYGPRESIAPLREWYHRDPETGKIRITIPARYGNGGIMTPHFVGYPSRQSLIVGPMQGRMQKQYDYTPQQYQALIHLTAALCKIFPRIECDAPRDAQGHVINHVLSHEQWENFHGVLGHYHIQLEKSDPGPAFQWDYVIHGARALMNNAESDRRD
ncbi:MAG TPA: N-acetylmuramoyl-L-alanine amidase [Tepidisphaeraceae bacterium]|jgi:N-acetyl-anhydromuramyl-L-alanine amidase AmpD